MSRAVDEHLFKRQGANKNSAEEKGFCPKKIIVARWPQWPAVNGTPLLGTPKGTSSSLTEGWKSKVRIRKGTYLFLSEGTDLD